MEVEIGETILDGGKELEVLLPGEGLTSGVAQGQPRLHAHLRCPEFDSLRPRVPSVTMTQMLENVGMDVTSFKKASFQQAIPERKYPALKRRSSVWITGDRPERQNDGDHSSKMRCEIDRVFFL